MEFLCCSISFLIFGMRFVSVYGNYDRIFHFTACDCSCFGSHVLGVRLLGFRL